MNRIFTIIIQMAAGILLTAGVFAQAPEKISYQAVIRDDGGNLVTEQEIGMQISILQGTADGSPIYVETQTPTTNANGLVSIEIGDGTVLSGDFITIDWSNGPYFIKTETDPAGGANYSITGTSQLLSVPYALHAKTAETVTGGITESDPVFSGRDAANITATDITNLSNLSGTNTGDQDISGIEINLQAIQDTALQIRGDIPDVSGFLTSESDPTFSNSQAANIDATDITNLSNLSGVNTGDQDLSTLATITALGDSTAQVRSEIPDVSGFLTSESDPTFTSSQAANIDADDITNLSNLSGVNTGDQDLSTLATKTALGDSTSQVRSEIPDVSGFLTSETDPTFTSSEAANITAIDIVNLGNLSGVNTGNQKLSLNNDTLFLSDDTTIIDLSELTIDKEWIFLTFPGSTINTATTVSIASSSGNLPISNNTITLHANVCYELDAKLVFNSTASIVYQWYDITNSLYLGNMGLYVGGTSQFGNTGTHFIIKPASDIEVDLRIRSVSASSTIQNNYSYGIIKEL